MVSMSRFRCSKVLPPQKQRILWVLSSEQSAGTKGKYSGMTKSHVNCNKGRITMAILWMLTESKTA